MSDNGIMYISTAFAVVGIAWALALVIIKYK